MTKRSPHLMARFGPDKRLRQQILDGRVDVNAQDDRGCTILHYAASSGRCELAYWLLGNSSIDASIRDHDGRVAGDYAPRGDPSCDPEEVDDWRLLREHLHAAAASARPT